MDRPRGINNVGNCIFLLNPVRAKPHTSNNKKSYKYNCDVSGTLEKAFPKKSKLINNITTAKWALNILFILIPVFKKEVIELLI